MFCLTWFTIPLLQAWVRVGDFRVGPRVWASARANLIYWSILGSIGIAALIYILVVLQIDQDTLLTMGMAAANAWGLLLITIMMGYGLVEVPRTLWYDADTARCLRYMEFIVPGSKESMVDAEAEIYDIARQIAIASTRIESDNALRPFVDKLLVKCPIARDDRHMTRNIERDELARRLDENYLTELHENIKRAIKTNDRTQAQYRFVLQKAFLYQDIIENYRNRDRKFISSLVEVRNDHLADVKLRAYWWWYVWIRPGVLRGISIVAMIASLAVIWSESTFQVENVTLSVPAAILQSPYVGYAATELVAMAFILYMCTCAYSTLFKIRFMDYYLVAEHHTDEGTLMFIGGYLCKLTFPLCYNFMNMVENETSVFIQYQGKAVNLTPLLGDGYNKWLPEIVLIFAVITLFNLHGRLLRLFKFKYYSYHEALGTGLTEIDEGRQIIELARTAEERKLNGVATTGYGGIDLSGDATSQRSRSVAPRSTGPRATNAKDLLAKYKNRNRTGGDADPGVSSDDIPISTSSLATQDPPAPAKWGVKTTAAFKGLFGPRAANPPPSSGATGKFQRLEEDIENGHGAPSRDSRDDSMDAGARKFGIASGKEAAGAGSKWGWGGSSAQPAPAPATKPAPTPSAGGTGAKIYVPGRPDPQKNMFDDI
ncbi:hypothetical protein HKX48_007319 [Thoreauomyces humboldtii]|nr:hypothetical protein HKX48_007319 [Thoreauomyces humboldtii]